jgi:hypothetical protein
MNDETMPIDEALAPDHAEDGAIDGDAEQTDDGLAVCTKARMNFAQLSGLGGGALFVLIPNSELIHSALRAVLGIGGYECC